jgi:hypothetical protein
MKHGYGKMFFQGIEYERFGQKSQYVMLLVKLNENKMTSDHAPVKPIYVVVL